MTGSICEMSFGASDTFDVESAIGVVTKMAVDATKLMTAIQMLLAQCNSDWHLAKKVVHCAQLCSNVEALRSVDGTSFKSLFMKALQSLYRQKDSLHAEKSSSASNKVNNSRWLSCVALLSQALVQMPLPDGSPMEVLVKPVFELLELCLSADATSEELECAATQLLDVGPALSKSKYCDVEQFNQLRHLVRLRLANGSASKLLLIDTVEGFASNWQPKPLLS
jgi:hypothetical protein